jgi:uncharacterized membrane protein YphA (DoxX/SURF4 family)
MRAFLERLRPFAPVPLRLLLAAIFILSPYGLAKLAPATMAGFKTGMAAWGLPPWMAPAIAWAGVVGGALLFFGFMTRLAALVLCALTVLLVVKTQMHASFVGGLDFPALRAVVCLSLVLSGAGRFSIDRRIFGGP